LAAGRVGSAKAELVADAAIERALAAIDTAPVQGAWPEDGDAVRWQFDGGVALVAIEDEGGKIDAFKAPELMQRAALAAGGLDPGRVDNVLGELRAARIKAEATTSLIGINSLDDLRRMTSLSGAEIERLRPVLTVRNGLTGPDPMAANAQVLGLLAPYA